CILAEAFNIGFGTSGGTTAHLNTLLDTPYHTIEEDFGAEEAKMVMAAARDAIDLVEGLTEKYGIDSDFSYEPGYLFASDEKEVEELEKIFLSTQKAGVVSTWTDHIPIPFPFKK